MSKYTILFLLLIFCLPAVTHAADDPYQHCTALVTSNPAQALSEAEAWYQSTRLPAARHCRALALFGLKRYKQSAQELENLLEVVGQQQPELWLNILQQASTARFAAGDTKRSLDILMLGISFADIKQRQQDMLSLLLKHSDICRQSGNTLCAIQDLDHATSLSPDDPTLRLKRAEVFIDLKEYKLAQQDIDGVLKRDPPNAAAQQLQARLPRK
jgi:predicted Zn-dependent protease